MVPPHAASLPQDSKADHSHVGIGFCCDPGLGECPILRALMASGVADHSCDPGLQVGVGLHSYFGTPLANGVADHSHKGMDFCCDPGVG